MSPTLSILIPTYERGAIVLDTIRHLINAVDQADEIVVLDQTSRHPADVERELADLSNRGVIRWVRLEEPSIPASLNRGLREAASELVLILDDDILPDPTLVSRHRGAFVAERRWVVAGQVVQPWQKPQALEGAATPYESLSFPFHSTIAQPTGNFMAGNVSMRRERALEVGGFDENFTGAAYRFETDFAWRILAAGGEIWFESSASVKHLKLSSGGLRALSDFHESRGPEHTAGDYYFARLHFPWWTRTRYLLRRLRQNVLTRHVLTHPRLFPRRLMGEWAGYRESARRFSGGRRLTQ